MNYFCAPVSIMGASLDQLLVFQTVDGGCNGTTRQQNLFSDFVNGEWTLVQESFEDGEVAAAHFQLGDAVFRVRLDRSRRLPQHEKNVNPGTSGQRFQLVCICCFHECVSILRYFTSRCAVK